MKKKVLFIVIVLLLVSGAGFMIYQATKGTGEETKEETTNSVATKKSDKETAYVNKDAKLSDITKEDGVVNIYMFWGNGCPHCKAEWEFLESIRKEHAGEFAVYGFEVWYSSENRELLNIFASGVGASEVTSVPLTIIGDEVISGFGTAERTGKEILNLIEAKRKTSFDVYFDKIK